MSESKWGFGEEKFSKLYSLFDNSGVSIFIEQTGSGGSVEFSKKLHGKKIKVEWDRDDNDYSFEDFYKDIVNYKDLIGTDK